MNLPEEWEQAGHFSFFDAKLSYNLFKNKIKWCENGDDSILDIGCATGYVTCNLILPSLPENFGELKAIDISSEMIEYARKNYKHPKVIFDLMDITEPITLPATQQFHHIISLFCLQWIPIDDQQQAFQNIFNLLKPNGDCIISILSTNPTHLHYLRMAKQQSKWSKYMDDLMRYVSPYHFMENPKEQAIQYLRNAGFTKYDVQHVDDGRYVFNMKVYREFARALNPFLKRIPTELHEEYLDEFVETIIQFNETQRSPVTNELEMIFNYKKVLIYAEK